MMRMRGKLSLVFLALLAAPPVRTESEVQPIGCFTFDRIGVSVDSFGRFVAATGMVTMEEREDGGLLFEVGVVRDFCRT
ncbi:MAG: hypothetical protein ACR2IG_08110 [Roseomonas sp.]